MNHNGAATTMSLESTAAVTSPGTQASAEAVLDSDGPSDGPASSPASSRSSSHPSSSAGNAGIARSAGASNFSGDIIDAFVTLADSLTTDYDTSDLLTHLAESAVHLLGVTAAGILLADPTGKAGGDLHLAASSSEAIAQLELFQLAVDDGPCLQCYSTGIPVMATNTDDVQRRWPTFSPAMSAQDLVSVVAVPLRLRGQVLGALGMFATSAGTPGAAAIRVAQGLADIATITLLNDRAASDSRALASQLQGALDSRVLIEQAKGVIATQVGTTIADAFLILRSTARRRGMRLTELAQAVVEGRTDATQLNV